MDKMTTATNSKDDTERSLALYSDEVGVPISLEQLIDSHRSQREIIAQFSDDLQRVRSKELQRLYEDHWRGEQTMIEQAKGVVEIITSTNQPVELSIAEQIALAQAMATIAQAEALTRIADRLELLCDTGTGYAGEPIAVLRTFALN